MKESQVTELRFVVILKERLKTRGYERHCTYMRERRSSGEWIARREGKLTKRVREYEKGEWRGVLVIGRGSFFFGCFHTGKTRLDFASSAANQP